MEADVPPPAPHWDAKLRFSLRAREAFVDQLAKVGLIAWRRRAKETVGVFFAVKKLGDVRMVVDCRPEKACHQSPPHSSLATAGALASINLADSWLGETDGDGSRTAPHAAAIDLADGYYQR